MTPEEMSALEWDEYEAEMAALEMEALGEALALRTHEQTLARQPLPEMTDDEIPF